MELKKCPYCGFAVEDTYFFCPTCGKKLKEPPMTLAKELGIYAISVFLPPLGLWPGIKYVLQNNNRLKRVGTIAIILTIVSTVLTLWLTIGFLSSVQKSLGQNGAQVNQLQNLGY